MRVVRAARMRKAPPTQCRACACADFHFLPRGEPAAMTSVPSVIAESSEEKQKRKRRSYDVAFKMEVIEYAETHNKMQAARQYDIHRRCVQTWCKTKDKLEVANSKRMRVAMAEGQVPVETVEVSISGISDGEILAALPVTCANVNNNVNDVATEVGAALSLGVISFEHVYVYALNELSAFAFV